MSQLFGAGDLTQVRYITFTNPKDLMLQIFSKISYLDAFTLNLRVVDKTKSRGTNCTLLEVQFLVVIKEICSDFKGSATNRKIMHYRSKEN